MNDSILRDVCYLDTNIFVYLHDSNAADKQRVSAFAQTGMGRISVQVLSEWRNVMVRKFPHLVDKEARRQFIRLLEAWQPMAVTPAVILRARSCATDTSSPPMIPCMCNAPWTWAAAGFCLRTCRTA
ncbi:MAG: hypothetical protein CDV28_1584 [Candidatus Electronema aureum]|uniref:PIN domain-containing protein n=1 Tax=Candidatus Electronema aureum TaxID=2005002 RepID=A0A521FYH3_9BACT|nr:MAG: hypothetical protein CDV28_1584 [Candidatus Electronema aureum]